jgi:Sec-independent protein secretion pathway component TatC
MMALPMYVLYEGGVLMSRLLVRDKPGQESGESA